MTMMDKLHLILSLILIPLISEAQYLTGIGTKWSDEFTEWTLYTEDEEVEGDLIMRWQFQNDPSEWDYRLQDKTGSIRLIWKKDPNRWEIRGEGKVITARTLWKNDFREWRITDNSKTLTLRSRYGNSFNEWLVKEKKHGSFEMYTSWENDPRDWNIVDDLDESISFPMKMALVFITVFHSSPSW